MALRARLGKPTGARNGSAAAADEGSRVFVGGRVVEDDGMVGALFQYRIVSSELLTVGNLTV